MHYMNPRSGKKTRLPEWDAAHIVGTGLVLGLLSLQVPLQFLSQVKGNKT